MRDIDIEKVEKRACVGERERRNEGCEMLKKEGKREEEIYKERDLCLS